MKKVIIIPKRFLRIAPQKGTVATRNFRTGAFTGRRAVSGRGDTTRTRYLFKDVDLNKDGRIQPWERGGTVHGRTVTVKASRRAKGYERRI